MNACPETLPTIFVISGVLVLAAFVLAFASIVVGEVRDIVRDW